MDLEVMFPLVKKWGIKFERAPSKKTEIKLNRELITLQSGIDAPPTIYFFKNAYQDILIATPSLLIFSAKKILS